MPLPEIVSHFLFPDLIRTMPPMLPETLVLSWAREPALAYKPRLPHSRRPEYAASPDVTKTFTSSSDIFVPCSSRMSIHAFWL